MSGEAIGEIVDLKHEITNQNAQDLRPAQNAIPRDFYEADAYLTRQRLENPHYPAERIRSDIRMLGGSGESFGLEGGEIVLRAYLDYVYDHRDKYSYIVNKPRFSRPNFIMRYVAGTNSYIKAIAEEQDSEKKKTLLGMAVNSSSLGQTFDKVRLVLNQDISLTEDQRVQVEKIGKLLLGLEEDDPRTFYAALEDLYASLHFEDYETNHEATEREVAMIQRLMAEKNLQNATVIDFGCGTGRILNSLAADEKVVRAIGIDPSATNIATAKADDTTGKALYKEGDWRTLDTVIEDGQADLILVMGRTLAHARNPEELDEWIRKLSEKLKKMEYSFLMRPIQIKGSIKRTDNR